MSSSGFITIQGFIDNDIFLIAYTFQVSLNARAVFTKAGVTVHHFVLNVQQDTTRMKQERQNVYHVLQDTTRM